MLYPIIGMPHIINCKKVFGGAADGQGGNDVLVGSAEEETLLGGAGDAFIIKTIWTAYNA